MLAYLRKFGPHFFEDDETGMTVTVTKKGCIEMLQKIFHEDSPAISSLCYAGGLQPPALT